MTARLLLSRHELPRVRAQALRTLAVVGDTEHVDAVAAGCTTTRTAVRRQAARALESLRAGWTSRGGPP